MEEDERKFLLKRIEELEIENKKLKQKPRKKR